MLCSLIQEEDHKFLEQLAFQEESDMAVKSARREKAQADASWMKKVAYIYGPDNHLQKSILSKQHGTQKNL